ncbi:hypothetical protein VTO42DRAFT_829 [Malbranchea cinnamomea]
MRDYHYLCAVAALGGLYLGYKYVQDYLEVEGVRRRENPEKPFEDPRAGFLGLQGYREVLQSIKEKRAQETSVQRFEEYGDTFVSSFFGRPMVITRDPENIKAILATQFEEFSLGEARYNSLAPFLGDGIFTHTYGGGPKGEPWRHSRAVLRPQFSKQQIQDLDVVEHFVQNLIASIPPNETVDLQQLFFKFTIDTATDFLFGESVNSLLSNNSREEEEFYKLFTRGTEICMLRVGLGDLYFLQPDGNEFKRITKVVHAFIDKFTRKALELRASGKPTSASRGQKYVFLEEIAQSIEDPVRLRAELLNILLAGRDTTASLLSICFHQLSRHKDVWAKLRHEILEIIGDRKPTYDDIKSLTYLRYVLNETLRLYPVVPWNAREAVITTTLPRGGGPEQKGKILVKKGTTIFYSAWGLHRSSFYGDDAHEFKPNRWENLRPGWNYLPFNGGPRICLGQQYALTEASYVVIRLLQTFEDIENRDPVHEFIEGLTLTMCSDRGTQVALKPAKSLA